MSQRWRQGTIHAFEPVPDLFRQLCENTQGLYNVYCYPFALGEKSGTATMFISSGTSDGSSSLLCPKEVLAEHPTVLFKDKIAVPVVTLDDWAKGNDIAKVDFLWLDVQGYELAVLKAAENVLRSVRAIYAEVNLKQLYEGGALYPELKEWLANRGFQVQREELPWPDAGNVLFVRRDNQTHGSAPSTPLPGYKPDFR